MPLDAMGHRFSLEGPRDRKRKRKRKGPRRRPRRVYARAKARAHSKSRAYARAQVIQYPYEAPREKPYIHIALPQRASRAERAQARLLAAQAQQIAVETRIAKKQLGPTAAQRAARYLGREYSRRMERPERVLRGLPKFAYHRARGRLVHEQRSRQAKAHYERIRLRVKALYAQARRNVAEEEELQRLKRMVKVER